MRKKVQKAITRLAVELVLATAPAVAFVAAPVPAAHAFTGSDGRTYRQFINVNAPTKCLGVTGGNMNNGNSVVLWDCHDPSQSPDQWWTLQDNTPVNFNGTTLVFQTFRNLVNFNKCLGVGGGGFTQGTPLVIWDCNGHPDQKWLWEGPASAGNNIINYNPFVNNNHDNMTVAVKSAATGNGATIVLWDVQSGHNDQVWASRL